MLTCSDFSFSFVPTRASRDPKDKMILYHFVENYFVLTIIVPPLLPVPRNVVASLLLRQRISAIFADGIVCKMAGSARRLLFK